MSHPERQKNQINNQLLNDGFLVVKRVLNQDMLNRLRAATDPLLDSYTEEEQSRSGNQGQIITMAYQETVFQQLIAWPGSLSALRNLGFEDSRFWSAYIISREPRTEKSYWHQDWPFWGESVSYNPQPHQLFLMFYLTDTTPANGCLRVLPKSHRALDLHEKHAHLAGEGHAGDVRHQNPAKSRAYSTDPEEIDVPVQAGDLVIGDARLLHATQANVTNERRTVITMWYLPRYQDLPENLKAAYQMPKVDGGAPGLYVAPPSDLPASERDMIQALLPNYEGTTKPAPWNRVPNRLITNKERTGRS